ncbi:MAG: peptidoglycan DD-metalloendopeptidase family protein [Cyclobacteriaceae bacterium]
MFRNTIASICIICIWSSVIFSSCNNSAEEKGTADQNISQNFNSELSGSSIISGPAPDTLSIAPPLVPDSFLNVDKRKVKYGDTFNGILKSLKVNRSMINTIVSQIPIFVAPSDFKVGNKYKVLYEKGNTSPYLLSYDLSDTTSMEINLGSGEVYGITRPITYEVMEAQGVINSSLVNSLVEAGLPEDLADRILSVFAWKIDFKNLKRGDQYKIIFEQYSVDGEVIGSDHINSIEFFHDGELYQAFGFDNGFGIEYFDEEGLNMSHAPLRFERITSLYAQRRFHPTRRRSLPHYGMDFEAPQGTPIESILKGVITRVRYDRANGNNVKIRHSKDLTTQYLHMSVIDSAMVVGDSVQQGQVIGLVGSTGYSSGPHLCLRVWYKGKQRDPLNFDFPRRGDVIESRRSSFEDYVAEQKELISQIE